MKVQLIFNKIYFQKIIYKIFYKELEYLYTRLFIIIKIIKLKNVKFNYSFKKIKKILLNKKRKF